MNLTRSEPRYQIDYSKPVSVYRNLHKKCWSIKQNGLVKAHTQWASLNECSFVVSQAGRERVLREKKKNVHAFIKGFLNYEEIDFDLENQATYNPYKYDSFVDKDTKEKLTVANAVKLEPSGVFYK